VYKQKNAMRKGLILNYSRKEREKHLFFLPSLRISKLFLASYNLLSVINTNCRKQQRNK